MADWDPARARAEGKEWRAERYEKGDWPTTRMLRTAFGTMTVAVTAAGLVPRRPPSRTRAPLRGPEEVLRAIREWVRRYGEPPTIADRDPFRARAAGHLWRVRRYERGDWPSAKTVRRHYGTFGQAVSAAGFEPRSRGGRTRWEVERRGRRVDVIAARSVPNPAAYGEHLSRRVGAVADARKTGDEELLRLALLSLAEGANAWARHLNG